SEASPELLAQAHQALGEYYFEQERWDLASEQFHKVIDSGTDDKWLCDVAWINIGECLNRTQKVSEAVDLYDEILDSNPSRRVRLDATLKRAVILRRLDRTEEALRSLEELLRDAAYINDFPLIELEVALCRLKLGNHEEARKGLENLVETNKRGELAARAYFELGRLLWERWHDLAGARSVLLEIKGAERSSEWVAAGDSLRAEIESLYGSWHWIGFLESQLNAIDSSLNRDREFLFTDTVYVDSLSLIVRKGAAESGGRRRSKRSRRNRLSRFAEKLPAAPDTTVDSTKTAVDDTVSALDSTALASLYLQRLEQLRKADFDLAEFHLFERNDLDSAEFYICKSAAVDDSSEIWGRSIASLAYIAKARGDSASRDSLYRLILARMPHGPFADRARIVLGLPIEPQEVDSLSLLLDQAESCWLDDDDPARAREIYHEVAERADSTSDVRARAMLAEAYLSREALRDDSTAYRLYAAIADQFSGTSFGRISKARTRGRLEADRERQAGGPDSAGKGMEQGFELYNGLEPELIDEGSGADYEGIIQPEKVFEPDDVDELPQMLTSVSGLRNLVRTYAPKPVPGAEATAGRVEMQFVVDKTGMITEVEVTSVDPPGMGFEEAARKVLKKLRYRAGRYHGQKVSTRMKQLFVFGEDDRPE
ncbi:MAG TPA: tetratricopeptide repeat protein, partial [Bacteroidetes bacterium]|nr:tetratricopeptide repeat protein [Bacteroidota bacterium]